MPLSEHVYCVATTLKMTEQVKQQICIKFWVKRFQVKLFGRFKGCSYGPLVFGNFIITTCPLKHQALCRGFWWNIKSPRWLSLPTVQIWPPATSRFSPNSNHLWKEEILDHWWDSENNNKAVDGDWENCVRSQGAYFEGDWGIIVLCTMFLVSRIFFNKCL